MATPFEGAAALLAAGTAAHHLGQRFAHMLNDMEMIGYNARLGQAKLDGFSETQAHIYAHRFHALRRLQSLQQRADLGLGTPRHHLEYSRGIQITQDGVVAPSFPPGELINA